MKSVLKRPFAILLMIVMLLAPSLSAGAVPVVRDTPQPVTGKSAETAVYEFFKNTVGLNEAACCGVLANISAESGFDCNSYGDYIDGAPTSYGLCQWHYSRWDRLKTYCNDNGFSPDSLAGQLNYLKYELSTYYPSTLSYLKSVSNTADGAYDAGYYWCYNFEKPANRESKAVSRGSSAATTYWSVYQYINESASKVSFTEEAAAGYYRVTSSSGAVVRSYPADNDENKSGTVPFDTVLFVDTLCTNSDGGQYYHISSGTWADHFISSQVLESAGAVDDPLTASGVNFPTKLIVGTAFTIEGSFSSKISGIRSASVIIYDSEGNSTGIGKSATMNRMEYNLVSLDSYVKFGNLTVPGKYTYRVEVKNASDTYVLEKEFEVVPVLAVQVNFDPNGGTCSTLSLTLSSGSPYGSLPEASREDCYFTGWYTQKSGGSKISSSTKIETENDHTLYAHWSIPAPTGLTAQSMSDGSVSLSWDSTPNAEGWIVYYRAAGYSAWNEYKKLTAKSCTVSGLSNTTNYEFSVKSYWTVSGAEELSAERSAVASAVSLTAPGTPSGLTAVHSADAVKVTWNSVPYASSYTVKYSPDGGEHWAEKSGFTGSGCSLSGLDDTLSYSFMICAVSSYGSETRTGSWSSAFSMPAKVIALSPKSLDSVSGDNGSVTLSWPHSGADGYQVYYRIKDASDWISGPWTDASETSVAGLQDKTNYEFRVQAVTLINGVRTSAADFSPTVECAVFKAPDAPKGVSAVRNADGSVTVSWQPVPDASGYTLYYAASGGSWISAGNISDTSYTLRNVKEANTYSIKVCTLGTYAGTTKAGVFSDPVTAPAKKVADAPASIRLTSNDDGSVSVSWSQVSGADGYRVSYRKIIYKNDKIDDYGDWVSCTPTGSLSYKVNGLTDLTNYQFRVSSYTLVDGSKTYSDDYSKTSTAPSLAKPGVSAIILSECTAGGGIHVTWQSVDGATGYILSYSVNGGAWTKAPEVRNPEYVLDGITDGTEYRFRVSAVCSAFGVTRTGDSSASVSQQITAADNTLSAPQITSVSSNADGSVTLVWNSPKGAQGYRIYYGRLSDAVSDGEDICFGTLSVFDSASHTATITGLEDMTGYVFCVRSCISTADGNYVSDEASDYVAAPSVKQPLAPTGVSVTRSEDNEAKIKWSPVSGAEEYELQHSPDGVNWTTVEGLSECSYIVRSVDENTRCYVRIRAVREYMGVSGISQYSSIFTLRAAGDPTAEVTAVSNNDGSISLTWEESACADGYRAYYRKVLDLEGGALEDSPWEMSEYVTEPSMTLTGLESMFGYEIKICAYMDINGVKTLLDDYSAFTRAPSILPPDAPENVRAQWIDNGTLYVSWDAAGESDKYHVLYSVDGTTWQKVVVLENTAAEITGIPSGSRCYVKVCVCRSFMGVSKLSPTREAVADLNK